MKEDGVKPMYLHKMFSKFFLIFKKTVELISNLKGVKSDSQRYTEKLRIQEIFFEN